MKRLVVVASADAAGDGAPLQDLEIPDAVVYRAHGLQGCLRVATAVGPGLVVLDARLPRRLDSLLAAHPVSAGARIVRRAPA